MVSLSSGRPLSAVTQVGRLKWKNELYNGCQLSELAGSPAKVVLGATFLLVRNEAWASNDFALMPILQAP